VRLSVRGNDLLVSPLAVTPDVPPLSAAGEAGLASAVKAAVDGPNLVYDRRLGAFRTLASAYQAVREQLTRDNYDVSLTFDPTPALPFAPAVAQLPRPYQQAAIQQWIGAGKRGVVVLPTGAGKTLVAMLAIQAAPVWTLVLVPTLDLLAQWRRAFLDILSAPTEHVATFGGGRRDVGPITIMTYDSAAIHTRELTRFGLLVFDEVHHLPAASYRRTAEGAIAPYRLGLSATPERSDGLDADLETLVGPTVFARSAKQLKAHLASYREQRIRVALSPEEQANYERARQTYRDFLRRRRIRIKSPEDFQQHVIWPSASDREAREAMLAHREARQLAFNASGKLHVLVDLLRRHSGDRVIIFSEFNSVVDEVSRMLLVPSITHRTPAKERATILERFRTGRYSKLVTGRVLNEGVDVPDANVAIVLSGTAARREYIQRLGRVLRPKQAEAVLYEIVADETDEWSVTRRRRGERTK
jgi:superfamily II DNA or RNA helicase